MQEQGPEKLRIRTAFMKWYLGSSQASMMGFFVELVTVTTKVFVKIFNSWKPLTIFAKKLHRGRLAGSYVFSVYFAEILKRNFSPWWARKTTQLTFTCLKSTIETLKKRCEICLKLTIITPGRHQWHCSGVFIINFEHIHTFFYCFNCWLSTCEC